MIANSYSQTQTIYGGTFYKPLHTSVCSGDLSYCGTVTVSATSVATISAMIPSYPFYTLTISGGVSPIGVLEIDEPEPALRSFKGSVHGKFEVEE